MANKVNVQFAVQTTIDGEITQFPYALAIDLGGDAFSRQRIDVGTTEEELEDGDVSAQGYMVYRARATNTANVHLGTKPAGSFIKHTTLLPGQAVLCRGNADNKWWAQAASGTQVLEFWIIES